MRIKYKGIIIGFFIVYIFVYALSSCSVVKADELNCETFVNEKICKMTPEEQKKWFWELLRKILEDDKEEKPEVIEIST